MDVQWWFLGLLLAKIEAGYEYKPATTCSLVWERKVR
jgi:hypothetical protein